MINGLPLHPIVVHIPVALAVLQPLIFFVIFWGLRKQWFTAPAWWLAVGLQAVMTVGGLVAMELGEDDEELVEQVVGDEPIHEHEEHAEQFVWAAGVVTLVSGLAGLSWFAPFAPSLRLASLAGSALVAGLAGLTGHTGGLLIYQHGAGAAYATKDATAEPVAPSEPLGEHETDDDEIDLE